MFIVIRCRCGAGNFFDRLSGHNRNTTAASSNRRGMDLGNDKGPVARRFFLSAVVRQVAGKTKEPMDYVIAHKFIGSASMRLAL